MTLAELQQMLDELNKLIGNPPREQLRRLDADIREHYLRPYQDLLREYVEAWDQAVLTRLDGMDQVQWPVAIKSQFALFRNKWRAKMRGANLRIHFGQMRVGPDFQGALTVNQTQVVGFPQDLVVGRPLQVVAAQLQQGNILSDQIPLQIFYDKKKWIAANNRCLTAHCLAGVRPLRIIPRLPDQVEINGLSEVEGQGEINDLQYQPGAIPRLIQQPRALPSNQMPITAGPNTWDVIQVATIPTAWQ